MKNLKLGIFSLLAIFAVSVFLTSCEQETILPSNDEYMLPAKAKEQLDLSITNWNEHFGNSVKAISYEVIGELNSASEVKSVVSDITAATSYIPTGDFQNPSTVTARAIQDNTDTEISSRVANLISDKIKTGQTEVKVKWELNGEPFYSTAVIDETGIVYDNMIFNTVIIEEYDEPILEDVNEVVEGPGMERSWKYNGWRWRVWKAKWLFGGTRGKGYVEAGAWCYNGTHYPQYDYLTTSGWFDVGTQKTKIRKLQPFNSCNRFKYVWGWAVGGSVSFNSSNFSIKATGVSRKAGSGQGGSCCHTKYLN